MDLKLHKPTGMILAGVFSSENTDTSAERIIIKGVDISDIENGTALINYEHKNEKNSESNGMEIVGRVISAKKIYSKEDCTNDLERQAWEEIKLPLIFGYGRLFDGAGHPGAMGIAAAIRDMHANKEKILYRWSVDGNTYSRSDNELTGTIVKNMAITTKPCNRASITFLVYDPNAPEGFEKNPIPKKQFPELEEILKKEALLPLESLNKAIEAGGYNVAPDQLSGGAALQKEHIIGKKSLKERVKELLSHDWKGKYNKEESRKMIKSLLPEISDNYIDHFENAIEDLHLRRSGIKKNEYSLYKMHNLEITLRKNIDDLKVSTLTDAHLPCIYVLLYKVDGKEYRAGRFMLYNNRLWHLEDYHKMLDNFLPEGPLTFDLVSKIYSLRNGPHTRIEQEEIPLGIEPGEKTEEPVEENAPQERPASVFDYFRTGMDLPHILEINNGEYYLDGNRLSQGEIQTIYDNLQSGLATLRYRAMPDTDSSELNKAEGDMDPASALTHIRSAVAAGHIHPDVERALTSHIYSDPMTGLGNKYAFTEFRKQNKPGVHVAADLNDFKSINDAFSHDVGDQAIKTFGHHAKAAAEEVAPGAYKSFRQGGDEYFFHLPSYEHAAMWARNLHQRLESLPPIGGVHKLTTTLGFGHTPEDADKAALMAKEQKYLPGQEGVAPRQKKSKFPLGQTPNLAHSLISGKEGPIKLHDPTPEAIKQSVPKLDADSNSEAKAA